MIFDITLKGYHVTDEGDDDKTSHLIKWVVAPDLDTLNRWIEVVGLRDHIEDPVEIYPGETLHFCNGIDVVVFHHLSSIKSPACEPISQWARLSKEALTQ